MLIKLGGSRVEIAVKRFPDSLRLQGGCDELQETITSNDWLGSGGAAFGRM
jgi:hypothetical protein